MKKTTILAALLVLAAVTLLATWTGCISPWSGTEGFSEDGGVVLQYFRMEGCPHCEKFDGVWKKLTASGAPSVEFKKYEAGSKEAEEHGVRAFPHIQMLVGDGQPKVFDGSRTLESLEDFINQHRQ